MGQQRLHSSSGSNNGAAGLALQQEKIEKGEEEKIKQRRRRAAAALQQVQRVLRCVGLVVAVPQVGTAAVLQQGEGKIERLGYCYGGGSMGLL
ncbi:hypothetical protein F0562_010712 [Nyssa sinensis]|uniref:Uncharacterized protein n=1 Tax=Nyssa sinensis TaxID=561372 RepID=A0A5J5A1W5_9ASTE|nr:hypothetical protein F0562_010712 [Nyssa sinensis]